jgi:hypothetical protein
MKMERRASKLLKLIQDHRRETETAEMFRDLGFGFKVGADGRVVPSLEVVTRPSAESS